jgi:Tol biopolymer transport system component/DNA-binding winged helix-turn-helix (wHTH) protein
VLDFRHVEEILMGEQDCDPHIRFGLFELDPRSGELRKSGSKIRLQQQPFEVLMALLATPGQIVTRDELQRRLWRDDTFVDFDHSLNAAIKRLRDALGDDHVNPRFIETVPRRGYRMIAPVTSGESAAASAPASTIIVSRKNLPRLTLPFLALSVAAYAGFLFSGSKPTRPMPTIVPVVTDRGEKNGLALSPDRQRIAYSWDGGEGPTSSIYVKNIGTSEPLRLTHGLGQDFSPVWSPDGRYIAFARAAEGNTGIYIVPGLGGVERKLVSTHWDDAFADTLRPRIAWSNDDQLLAYSDIPPAGGAPSIFVLSLKSLETMRLTHPPAGSGGDFNPAFSGDAARVAFLRDGKEVFTVGSIASSGGEENLLSPPLMGLTMFMTWNSSRMIISNGQLSEFSLSDGKLAPLLAGNYAYYPSLQGDRLAFLAVRRSINLWSRNLSGIGPASSISSSTRDTLEPAFSPDGTHLAFASTRSGAPEIWTSRSDGTAPVQLTAFSGPELGAPQWSTDGKQIAFDSRTGQHAQIFLINADGGPPRRVMTGAVSNADNVVPSWSPDGRWIYFSSNSTGEWEIWKTPVKGGASIQITRHGGFAAFESHDGQFVYYAKGEKLPGIWRVPASGGEEKQVLQLPQAGFWAYWALEDDGLIYLDADRPEHPWVCFFAFATGRTTRVFQLANAVVALAPGLAISPDRRTIVYPQIDASDSDIVLAERLR